MNMNEVIANIAKHHLGHPLGGKYPVHPNDHVNLSQSSNDSFPTAMHLSYAQATVADELRRQVQCFADIVKMGRTHLQDATSLSVGDEIGAWATQIEQAELRIESGLKEIYTVAQGGTAVGTGLNAPKGFDSLVCERLAELTGLPFVAAEDKFVASLEKPAKRCRLCLSTQTG